LTLHGEGGALKRYSVRLIRLPVSLHHREIEELKKRLKEATDMIKSRDDSISARDTQIARHQSELDVIRALQAKTKVWCRGQEGGGVVDEWESD
jgi:hypothetical protein